MICLGPDELTINKLDNMELREITGTTRSNYKLYDLNLWLGQALSKNKT
jgi:hypothetical protein